MGAHSLKRLLLMPLHPQSACPCTCFIHGDFTGKATIFVVVAISAPLTGRFLRSRSLLCLNRHACAS